MKPLVLLAAALAFAAVAAAQGYDVNGTINGSVNGTANGTDNGTSNTTPPNFTEEPAAPASPFPVGLALLVVGAAVVVGLLVYAAARP